MSCFCRVDNFRELVNSLHHLRCAIAAFVFSLQLLTTPVWAQDANSLSKALQTAYTAGDNARALDYCEQLLNMPRANSWTLHYYHANILSKLGRLVDARAEYSFVLSKTPDPTTKEYCKEALNSLSGHSNSSTSSNASSITERIGRQADNDSNAFLGAGQTEQELWRRAGDEQARLVQNRASIMSSQRLRVGKSSVPLYTQAEIDAQHDLDVDAAEQARSEAQAKGALRLEAAKKKAFESESAAANLSSQFASTSPSGFHLSEQGTNFYVRQYVPTTSSNSNAVKNPNPATVSVTDLASQQQGYFQAPLQATAKALNPSMQKMLDAQTAREHKANVYGSLLKPGQSSNTQ